jgi:small conductance mechanosensitive channel
MPTIPADVHVRFDNIVFTIGAIILCLFISFLLRKATSLSFKSVQTRRLIPEAFIGKTNTLNSVIFNLLDVALFGTTILIILSHWKVDISPILTGAGILGLAISFGSQTLVKDIISGFFIISESQYNIGDMVKIGEYTGKVSKVTLRLTVLKDEEGNRIYIPNSTITTVKRIKVVKKSTIIKNPKASLKKKKESVDKTVILREYHA